MFCLSATATRRDGAQRLQHRQHTRPPSPLAARRPLTTAPPPPPPPPARQDSAHFKNEQRKQAAVDQKIAQLRARAARLPASELAARARASDARVAALEAGRELGRRWLHVDMDAFYAAVEERDAPALKEVPMAVGGTGMITTANYKVGGGVWWKGLVEGFGGRVWWKGLVKGPARLGSAARPSARLGARHGQRSARTPWQRRPALPERPPRRENAGAPLRRALRDARLHRQGPVPRPRVCGAPFRQVRRGQRGDAGGLPALRPPLPRGQPGRGAACPRRGRRVPNWWRLCARYCASVHAIVLWGRTCVD